MKKLVVMLLILAMVLGMAACGGTNTPTNQSGQTDPSNNASTGNETSNNEDVNKPEEKPQKVDISFAQGKWLDLNNGQLVMEIKQDNTFILDGKEYEVLRVDDIRDGMGKTIVYTGGHVAEGTMNVYYNAQNTNEEDFTTWETFRNPLKINTYYAGMVAGSFYHSLGEGRLLVPDDAGFEWISADLTKDNFNDYFYLSDVVMRNPEYDAFGDWTQTQYRQYIYLNRNYLGVTGTSNTMEENVAAIEYDLKLSKYYTVKVDKKTGEILEKSSIKKEKNAGKITRMNSISVSNGMYILDYIGDPGTNIRKDWNRINIAEFSLKRIQGTMHFVKYNGPVQ